MDENKRIVICRRCKKPEYWGEMRWLSGFCVCRDCYKAQWESENHKEAQSEAEKDGSRESTGAVFAADVQWEMENSD